MNFDWAQYLTLAKELAGVSGHTGSQEARFRSALSRRYYTAYHAALTRANRRGYRKSPNTGVHEGLIAFFQTQPDPNWVQVGQDLETLRILRVKADYYDSLPPADITSNNVLLNLLLVDGVLTDLRALH